MERGSYQQSFSEPLEESVCTITIEIPTVLRDQVLAVASTHGLNPETVFQCAVETFLDDWLPIDNDLN